ncbi:hypothetical protein C8F01DRAFT_1118738 [Mycena amicta]|nr:hypothetical protein C8F01DRAFT_1118738 [Mycena amicta]
MPDADSKGKGKTRVIPVPDDPSNPYLVRITTHGKITAFVTFALQFFEKYENIPIVFHTIPAPKGKGKDKDDAKAAGAGDAGKEHTGASSSKSKPSKSDTTGLPSISQSALLTPRLISVVEIVKREYLKALAGELTGLYQYNEVGILEELPHPEYAAIARRGQDAVGEEEGDPEKVRAQAIATMLGGKNHIQTKQTPYMKITLSRVEIPGFKQASQEPLKRKLSKSAKTRAKRREKKLASGVDGEGDVQMQMQDGSESE